MWIAYVDRRELMQIFRGANERQIMYIKTFKSLMWGYSNVLARDLTAGFSDYTIKHHGITYAYNQPGKQLDK